MPSYDLRISRLEDRVGDLEGNGECPPSTVGAYLKTNGARCPSCGHKGVETDNLRARLDRVYQDAECPECGVTWVEIYDLVGYCELDD